MPKPTVTLEKPKEVKRYSLVLGLRRHYEGPFKGLWELADLTGLVNANGNERIIIDATDKLSIIGKSNAEMRRCI